MTNTTEGDSLKNCNILSKDNAEQELVSAMFASTLSTSSIIDRYSSWLLTGTGVTAVIFITQTKDILPIMTESGFKYCGLALIIASIFGFFAKITAVICEIYYKTDIEMRKVMPPIFEKYEEEQEEIKGYAKNQNVTLETEINMNNVIDEYCKHMPKFIAWKIKRDFKKNKDDRQIAYRKAMKIYTWQSVFMSLQTISFIVFMALSFYYVQGSLDKYV